MASERSVLPEAHVEAGRLLVGRDSTGTGGETELAAARSLGMGLAKKLL